MRGSNLQYGSKPAKGPRASRRRSILHTIISAADVRVLRPDHAVVVSVPIITMLLHDASMLTLLCVVLFRGSTRTFFRGCYVGACHSSIDQRVALAGCEGLASHGDGNLRDLRCIRLLLLEPAAIRALGYVPTHVAVLILDSWANVQTQDREGRESTDRLTRMQDLRNEKEKATIDERRRTSTVS